MNSIHEALAYQLESIRMLLEQIDNNAFIHSSQWISQSTIGQHSRHVIELVQCLIKGYDEGLINYDNRERNHDIETNKFIAIEAILELLPNIAKHEKSLTLVGNFDTDNTMLTHIKSTYERELVYNIEHAIHHMALIKVVLKELNLELVNENFGVAYATVQYRKLCAQ